MALYGDTEELLLEAEEMMVEGRGDDILLRYHEFDGAPVTANRYHALAARRGDDDMFSSDFSDEELAVSPQSFLCTKRYRVGCHPPALPLT